MYTQIKKSLVLTKEERNIIRELYNILDDDYDLTLNDTWDLLTDIACMGDADFLPTAYGYDIKITD